jgi:hypothetical protein
VTFKVSDAENAGYVYQISSGPDTPLLPVEIKPERRHFLSAGDVRPSGLWYRVDADLHVLWYLSRRRTTKLILDGFKGFVASGFMNPGRRSTSRSRTRRTRPIAFPMSRSLIWWPGASPHDQPRPVALVLPFVAWAR